LLAALYDFESPEPIARAAARAFFVELGKKTGGYAADATSGLVAAWIKLKALLVGVP